MNRPGFSQECLWTPVGIRDLWWDQKGKGESVWHRKLLNRCLKKWIPVAWNRLSNRRKIPRKWWYPIWPSELNGIEGDAARKAHSETSKRLSRAMLTLLAFSLFCLFTMLKPDRDILVEEEALQVPLVNARIPVMHFLVVAPLMLVGITVYLHIFLEHKLRIEHVLAAREDGLHQPYVDPTIFNIEQIPARFLSSLIFYWLTPLVIAFLTWKVLGLPLLGRPLFCLFLLVTTSLVFLQVRRCPDGKRLARNTLRWMFLFVLAAGGIVVVAHPALLWRPFDLRRADLAGRWLHSLNLRMADLRNANLMGATLSGANLQNANFDGATLANAILADANLSGASFRGSTLAKADLRRAKLEEADFGERADLSNANLSDANLAKAKLNRAVLRDVTLCGAVLTHAELQSADLSRANLRECSLVNSDITMANLSSCDLAYADLRDATLVSAVMRGAVFYHKSLEKELLFTGGDPGSTEIAEHNDYYQELLEKSGADLSQADLSEAILLDARLNHAKLIGAKLHAADLTDAVLQGADLSDAEFDEAMLSRADIRGARVTCDQLYDAYDWEQAYRDEGCGEDIPPPDDD